MTALKDSLFSYTGAFARNRKATLVSELLKFVRLVSGKTSRSFSIVIYRFVHQMFKLYKAQGLKGLVINLKSMQIALAQALAGVRKDLRLLGPALSVTGSGIPRIIPVTHRLRICQGDKLIIRLWLSLFGIYRVLEYPGKVSFRNIYRPGPVKDLKLYLEFSKFLTRFIDLLKAYPRSYEVKLLNIPDDYFDAKTYLGQILRPKWFQSLKSAPASRGESPSMDLMVLVRTLLSWSSSDLYPDVIQWFPQVGAGKIGSVFSRWVQNSVAAVKVLKLPMGVIPLGKLALKAEPAGKVRVFALVDYFTQVLLRPLHLCLFEILSLIPQDGTFDQEAPIVRFIQKMEDNHMKYCYSYDLSAATDRLPVDLQEDIIKGILTESGSFIAYLWRILLVAREYALPIKDPFGNPLKEKLPLKYKVGQPIGALSSWAMLALTHHFIVQFCAMKVGYTSWFQFYLVLGDDIVIGDIRVARLYKSIIRTLGVSISAPKSLVSNNLTLEFAKRFYYKGMDVSPISIKEFQVACSNASILAELVSKISIFREVRLADIMKSMGWGYRAIGSLSKTLDSLSLRVRRLMVLLRSPGNGPFSLKFHYDWITLHTWDLWGFKVFKSYKPIYQSLSDKILDPMITKLEGYLRALEYSAKPEYHLGIGAPSRQSGIQFPIIWNTPVSTNTIPEDVLKTLKLELRNEIWVPILVPLKSECETLLHDLRNFSDFLKLSIYNEDELNHSSLINQFETLLNIMNELESQFNKVPQDLRHRKVSAMNLFGASNFDTFGIRKAPVVAKLPTLISRWQDLRGILKLERFKDSVTGSPQTKGKPGSRGPVG